MATTLAMGGTLRHLRELFDDGTSLGVGDGQLLARYGATRDEAAFAALVARHGPMVLATCRALLRSEPDIEDAFQATFLVLAKKARSVRAGEALGGWLHRVAYRVAMQASVDARRRRQREAEAAAMIPVQTHSPHPEPDVAAIVHQELDRLPEKHRLPVVLCDLEGLSYEQAAGQLRWTVPTLRCRLAKARQQLQGRLSRRGLGAGALGVVLAGQAAGARAAAVPASLARSAVAAAASGTAPATVAALTSAVIRAMALAKLKLAAAGLAMAAVLGSIGVAALGPRWPGAATVPQAAGSMERPAAAKAAPAPSSAEMIDVRGRVVDPAGRPVAGARVRAYHPNREARPFPETTSGPDGRFAMRVRPGRGNSLFRRPGGMYPWVVASAPGFGPGWASAVREPGEPDEATIRLAEDGPPIEGRILDLEGRPVAGARVKVHNVFFAPEGRLADWLDRARSLGSQGPRDGLEALPAAIAASTGPDGRFRLTGIGRDRLAEILVSGPTIATTQLLVTNLDGPATVATNPVMIQQPTRITYHARRFDYAAEPTRPIEGTIRDRDTGRPIPGVRLQGMVYEETSLLWAPGVEATSDAQGHYRLDGLARGPSYRLLAEPGKGLPYPGATFRTPAGSAAPEPLRFDMTLKRGVLVRGRVTDKSTGRPVSGSVEAYTFADGEYTGHDGHTALIGDDGRYEVVAIPGRGILACRSDLGRYRIGAGAGAIKGFDPKLNGVGGFPTLPQPCLPSDYHVLAEIHPDPARAETTMVDLQVDPGRTLTIRVEDPEGRPLGGTKAGGLTDLAATFEYPQDSPAIEVRALHPSRPRRVTIRHEGRKLAGSVYLKGDEAGPLTVRLQPWGVLTGRIVDQDGQPRGGLSLSSVGGFRPGSMASDGFLPGANQAPGLQLGRDGRFRVEGLVPGLKYGAYAIQKSMNLGAAFRDVVVAPGEVKDLGDIKVVPLRPGD